MSSCEQCGNVLQDDWNTCPYCSAKITFTDSVVMGNITTINEPSAISTAIETSTKCLNCKSSGIGQYSCIMCQKIAFCDVCRDDDNRRKRKIAYEFMERTCKSCFVEEISNNLQSCNNCGYHYPSKYHKSSTTKKYGDSICEECTNLWKKGTLQAKQEFWQRKNQFKS